MVPESRRSGLERARSKARGGSGWGCGPIAGTLSCFVRDLECLCLACVRKALAAAAVDRRVRGLGVEELEGAATYVGRDGNDVKRDGPRGAE